MCCFIYFQKLQIYLKNKYLGSFYPLTESFHPTNGRFRREIFVPNWDMYTSYFLSIKITSYLLYMEGISGNIRFYSYMYMYLLEQIKIFWGVLRPY